MRTTDCHENRVEHIRVKLFLLFYRILKCLTSSVSPMPEEADVNSSCNTQFVQ